MKTYLFSYRYQENMYSIEIPACSYQEAKERLEVIPWGKYDGILKIKIPAISGNWLLILIFRIRNWIISN